MTKQIPNKESFCRNIVFAGKCQLTRHMEQKIKNCSLKNCDKIPEEMLIVFVVEVGEIQYKQWRETKTGLSVTAVVQ